MRWARRASFGEEWNRNGKDKNGGSVVKNDEREEKSSGDPQRKMLWIVQEHMSDQVFMEGGRKNTIQVLILDALRFRLCSHGERESSELWVIGRNVTLNQIANFMTNPQEVSCYGKTVVQ